MSHDLRGRLVAHYRLVEELGEGGRGVVWRARDDRLERDVAIKLILPENHGADAPRRELRLVVEARAAAAIKSRHVVQVYDLGTCDDGSFYLIMEMLRGETLLSLLMREGPLDPKRAVRIARHVAKGMMAAHALGILHRDLKPANVMLVDDDGEREVAKVLDFGVAKRMHSDDLIDAGVVLGSAHFMSPEQMSGAAIDSRSDIYSFGALLFRMLAGTVPFDTTDRATLSQQVMNNQPRSLVGFAVSPKLNAIVMRCLEKQRENRFATMADVDTALLEYLEGDRDLTIRTTSALPTILAGLRRTQQAEEGLEELVPRQPAQFRAEASVAPFEDQMRPRGEQAAPEPTPPRAPSLRPPFYMRPVFVAAAAGAATVAVALVSVITRFNQPTATTELIDAPAMAREAIVDEPMPHTRTPIRTREIELTHELGAREIERARERDHTRDLEPTREIERTSDLERARAEFERSRDLERADVGTRDVEPARDEERAREGEPARTELRGPAPDAAATREAVAATPQAPAERQPRKGKRNRRARAGDAHEEKAAEARKGTPDAEARALPDRGFIRVQTRAGTPTAAAQGSGDAP